jgi:hypothetical protein
MNNAPRSSVIRAINAQAAESLTGATKGRSVPQKIGARIHGNGNGNGNGPLGRACCLVLRPHVGSGRWRGAYVTRHSPIA